MATTLKAIDNKIATFSTNRAKLQSLGHEIAMLIFMHAAPTQISDDCSGTGDCTRAVKLAAQMPKSWQTQLENWFKAYTPIRIVTKNNKCEYAPKYKAEKDVDAKLAFWKLEEANNNPFYGFEEPESAKESPTLARLLAMIEGLAGRIDKLADKKEAEGGVIDADKPQAKMVVAALKAMDFSKIKALATAAAANDSATTDDDVEGASKAA
jgi:hypothetical protein